MPGSGWKREIINPRERAISTDINRLQAFRGNDLSSLFQYMFDIQATDTSSEGNGAIVSVTTNPMNAQVVWGLVGLPQIGSTNTLVSGGLLFCSNPDAAPSVDDSAYNYVNDPGVTDGTLLPMPPNASGSTIVGILECSRADTILETDNRDIFNASTGFFSPAVVNKVGASRLAYRWRTNTLAAGVTTASGWLPIMVALIPNGAATWNDCPKIWDVRPLVSDAYRGWHTKMIPSFQDLRRTYWSAAGITNTIKGYVEAQDAFNRRVGGFLTPDTTQASLDLTSNLIQEGGFAAPGLAPLYLYLMQPFGLPRWCEYTAVATGLRAPGRRRGIPVMSVTPPLNISGFPSAAINLPTGYGWPQNTQAGVCVAYMGGHVSGNKLPRNNICDGLVTWLGDVFSLTADVGFDQNVANFTVVGGTHYPRGAKALYVAFTMAFAGNMPNSKVMSVTLSSTDSAGGGSYQQAAFTAYYPNTIPYSGTWLARIPLEQNGGDNSVLTHKLVFSYAGGVAGYVVAPTSATATINGWEVGSGG